MIDSIYYLHSSAELSFKLDYDYNHDYEFYSIKLYDKGKNKLDVTNCKS